MSNVREGVASKVSQAKPRRREAALRTRLLRARFTTFAVHSLIYSLINYIGFTIYMYPHLLPHSLTHSLTHFSLCQQSVPRLVLSHLCLCTYSHTHLVLTHSHTHTLTYHSVTASSEGSCRLESLNAKSSLVTRRLKHQARS